MANNLQFVGSNNGKVTYKFTVDESMVNSHKVLHGSYVAFVVDETSTKALELVHPTNKRGVSVNIGVTYLQLVNMDQVVTVESECMKIGSNMAYLESTLKCSNGTVVAIGRHNKFVG
jgi:uncharacterized protein (TIGR00369 family)